MAGPRPGRAIYRRRTCAPFRAPAAATDEASPDSRPAAVRRTFAPPPRPAPPPSPCLPSPLGGSEGALKFAAADRSIYRAPRLSRRREASAARPVSRPRRRPKAESTPQGAAAPAAAPVLTGRAQPARSRRRARAGAVPALRPRVHDRGCAVPASSLGPARRAPYCARAGQGPAEPGFSFRAAGPPP